MRARKSTGIARNGTAPTSALAMVEDKIPRYVMRNTRLRDRYLPAQGRDQGKREGALVLALQNIRKVGDPRPRASCASIRVV